MVSPRAEDHSNVTVKNWIYIGVIQRIQYPANASVMFFFSTITRCLCPQLSFPENKGKNNFHVVFHPKPWLNQMFVQNCPICGGSPIWKYSGSLYIAKEILRNISELLEIAIPKSHEFPLASIASLSWRWIGVILVVLFLVFDSGWWIYWMFLVCSSRLFFQSILILAHNYKVFLRLHNFVLCMKNWQLQYRINSRFQ